MAEELSAYEQQRLANIRANHAELVRLGIMPPDSSPGEVVSSHLGIKRPRESKPKRKLDDTVEPQQPERWSSRVAQIPVTHVQLSAEDADEEVRQAERLARLEERKRIDDRPHRQTKQVALYEDKQAAEILQAQERLLTKKADKLAQQKEAARKIQATALALREANTAISAASRVALVQPSMRPPNHTTVNMSTAVVPAHSAVVSDPTASLFPMPPDGYRQSQTKRYYTQGEPAVCPVCGGTFVRRKDGALRKHDCEPLQQILPSTQEIPMPPIPMPPDAAVASTM